MSLNHENWKCIYILYLKFKKSNIYFEDLKMTKYPSENLYITYWIETF